MYTSLWICFCHPSYLTSSPRFCTAILLESWWDSHHRSVFNLKSESLRGWQLWTHNPQPCPSLPKLTTKAKGAKRRHAVYLLIPSFTKTMFTFQTKCLNTLRHFQITWFSFNSILIYRYIKHITHPHPNLSRVYLFDYQFNNFLLIRRTRFNKGTSYYWFSILVNTVLEKEMRTILVAQYKKNVSVAGYFQTFLFSQKTC